MIWPHHTLPQSITVNHLDLDPGLQENISLTYYEAGHMMYTHMDSLQKMKDDLDAFLDEAPSSSS